MRIIGRALDVNYRLLLLLAWLTPVFGENDQEKLWSDSPFLPAGSAASPVPEQPSTFELHGVMQTSQGISFSIYDATKRTARWMKLGEVGSGVTLREHAVVNGDDQVTIEVGGGTAKLTLKRSKINPGQLARPPAPPASPNATAEGDKVQVAGVEVEPEDVARMKIMAATRERIKREGLPSAGAKKPGKPNNE
jgi:hypothetical protein